MGKHGLGQAYARRPRYLPSSLCAEAWVPTAETFLRAPVLATARQKSAHSPLPTPRVSDSLVRHRRGAMALMVPAHAGLEHGHALSQPWVSHHEGSETYGVTVGRPITGRTSGRPIRTPPPAAPPLACGITLGRSACGIPSRADDSELAG